MKKGLLGCLLVGVVLILVGAGVAWWFVLRPMIGSETTLADAPREWAGVAEAELAIRNQAPFAPPADARLTQDQVNRFVAVQSNLQLRLGSDFPALQRAAEAAAAAQGANTPPAGAPPAADAALLARARQAQVEGLNYQRMSLAEYRWIREQAYKALPFLDMDPDAIVPPKPPEGAMVDAATGEIIQPDELGGPLPEGAEVAGTIGDEPWLHEGEPPADGGFDLGTPAEGPPVDTAEDIAAANAAAAQAEMLARADAAAGSAVGDDRALDDAATQAARANAVLLRPHHDLLVSTLGSSWMGL